MPDYRVRLRLSAPLGTPLASGTLFGHLCWAWRAAKGEDALLRWLAELPQAPFLVSDGFPAGFLPRPLLAPATRPARAANEKRHDFLERITRAKQERRRAWLPVETFLALRGALDETSLASHLLAAPKPRGSVLRHRSAHNTIDRRTGTTPDSGGLFFIDEEWRDDAAAEVDVYVSTALPREEIGALFAAVGETGYGRDASTGRGTFTAHVEAPDPRLFEAHGARRMSLSRGVLSANMHQPRYRLAAHYGKLGGLLAGSVRDPFKKPIILARPGTTFTPADEGPFGALLTDVHPARPGVVHNAWHLCVAFDGD